MCIGFCVCVQKCPKLFKGVPKCPNCPKASKSVKKWRKRPKASKVAKKVQICVERCPKYQKGSKANKFYLDFFLGHPVGVLRETAHAPPTKPPTGHQMSRQGLAQNDQKCQFWAKFGHFWAKNPFFTGEIKSFVTHITENPPRHLVHIVFWSGIGQNVQKMAIFGPK